MECHEVHFRGIFFDTVFRGKHRFVRCVLFNCKLVLRDSHFTDCYIIGADWSQPINQNDHFQISERLLHTPKPPHLDRTECLAWIAYIRMNTNLCWSDFLKDIPQKYLDWGLPILEKEANV